METSRKVTFGNKSKYKHFTLVQEWTATKPTWQPGAKLCQSAALKGIWFTTKMIYNLVYLFLSVSGSDELNNGGLQADIKQAMT